ncbi:MAG: hypothetical protein LBR88_02825, partial [Zoogloeaceae bacterium]|nr:hypothetical protein [Zoogloeaceae bacterium]
MNVSAILPRPAERMARLRRRAGQWRPARWLALGVLLALVMLAALCIGRYTLPMSHVSAMLLSHVIPSDWMDLRGGGGGGGGRRKG